MSSERAKAVARRFFETARELIAEGGDDPGHPVTWEAAPADTRAMLERLVQRMLDNGDIA